jgi:nucleoside-diphosphate-sugar epimerase
VTKVVHLASLISRSSERNPPLACEVNIGGTVNVFEAASLLNVEKVVWASSIIVYGDRSVNDRGVIDDDSPLDPPTVYGATKEFLERLAVRYSALRGLDITGLRLSRVYGWGQHIRRGRGSGSSWLSALMEAAALEEPNCVVPFGDKPLDLQYVEDVSRCFMTALSHRNHDGRTYLTHGDHRTVREAFEYVRSLLPFADLTLVEGGEMEAGATQAWSRKYSARAIKEELGFEPRWSMEDGIKETINAYRSRAGLSLVG